MPVRSLLAADTRRLKLDPATEDWGSTGKLTLLPGSFVDRAGITRAPFRFEIYPPFKLPEVHPHGLTYEGCCDLRAAELLAASGRLGVPIAVLYSGGIDSTVVLVSLMKQLSERERRERLVVFMTVDSISENPRFYDRYVRRSCNFRSADGFSTILNGDYLVTGGEHNDQLLGTDAVLAAGFAGKLDRLTRPWQASIDVLRERLGERAGDRWFEILREHVARAPCEISTVTDLFWWWSFCFEWQMLFFRPFLRIDRRIVLNRDLISTYYHQFFGSESFQLWSMLHPEHRRGGSPYKAVAKQVILDYDGDEEYFKMKGKGWSLHKLFLQRATAVALTSDLELLDDLDPNEFYVPESSFTSPA